MVGLGNHFSSEIANARELCLNVITLNADHDSTWVRVLAVDIAVRANNDKSRPDGKGLMASRIHIWLGLTQHIAIKLDKSFWVAAPDNH